MSLLSDYAAILSIDVPTYQRNPTLLNKFVKPGVTLKSVSSTSVLWKQPIMLYRDDQHIEASEDDLNKICFDGSTITITSNDETKTFSAPDEHPQGFTASQLLDAILEVEQIVRPKTEWFGGIDAHHIYFEGLHPEEKNDNCFVVMWGS